MKLLLRMYTLEPSYILNGQQYYNSIHTIDLNFVSDTEFYIHPDDFNVLQYIVSTLTGRKATPHVLKEIESQLNAFLHECRRRKTVLLPGELAPSTGDSVSYIGFRRNDLFDIYASDHEYF